MFAADDSYSHLDRNYTLPTCNFGGALSKHFASFKINDWWIFVADKIDLIEDWIKKSSLFAFGVHYWDKRAVQICKNTYTHSVQVNCARARCVHGVLACCVRGERRDRLHRDDRLLRYVLYVPYVVICSLISHMNTLRTPGGGPLGVRWTPTRRWVT